MVDAGANAPVISLLASQPDWLAINKPAGIGVHQENEQPGITTLLEQQLGYRVWLVHRLDTATSGILLLARNADSAALLSSAFAERQVSKYYIATSQSRPKKKQGWIKGDMIKARNGCWKLARSMDNPAITRFISRLDESTGRRQFLLKPTTGKTHQLRVALQSLGASIDGDTRYKGAQFDRLYLHATHLEFPFAGEQISIACSPAESTGNWGDIPEDWLTQTPGL